jgi:hypothetical protein
MTTKNVEQSKGKQNQKESQTPKEAIVSINELAKKLSILPNSAKSFIEV